MLSQSHLSCQDRDLLKRRELRGDTGYISGVNHAYSCCNEAQLRDLMPSRKNMPEFHQLMKDLLKFMQIPPSRLADNEVYSFTIDHKTEICFLQQQPGALDMLVHAATLTNPKADAVLRSLLQMNLFAPSGPSISIGMNPKTGVISLWARISLAGMDVSGLVELIELAVQRASAVRRALREQGVTAPGGRTRRTGIGMQLDLAMRAT